jgi:hypothetical protein
MPPCPQKMDDGPQKAGEKVAPIDFDGNFWPIFAQWIKRRQTMARCQRNDALPT